MYKKISDYALIGNTLGAALVSSDASIDWCCLPRFDRPAIFLRILDETKGGCCEIQVQGMKDKRRKYMGDSNILETTILTADGSLQVIDFMPIRKKQTAATSHGADADAEPQIIRILRCVEGSIACRIETRPTLGNAESSVTISKSDNGRVVSFSDKTQVLHVQSSVPGQVNEGRVTSNLRLSAGKMAYLVLTCMDVPGEPVVELSEKEIERLLNESQSYWKTWVQGCSFEGEFRDAVVRSALVLKSLVYEPSGAIVAAPTNSLPEWIGGERNWDYRYCWLRDSSLTINALMNIGYMGEARDFLYFLHRTLPKSADKYQIMYGLNGETHIEEEELKHLDGYQHSRPVRCGNGAVHQTQLDIFGELAHANYAYWTHPSSSGSRNDFERDAWPVLQTVADFVSEHWEIKGSGMWERRGEKQHYTASVGMCWVVLDRVIRLAEIFDLQSSRQSAWEDARRKIYKSLVQKGFHTSVNAFTQTYDSDAADAAILRFPIFGVLGADDVMMRSTIDFVERRLLRNGLMYRYRDGKDGLTGQEGTFTACAFWLAENLILQNRIDAAEELFRRVLSHANDVGLLSEEINPENGELLGNFPQGFSHIALINAAVRIAGAKAPQQSRSIA